MQQEIQSMLYMEACHRRNHTPRARFPLNHLPGTRKRCGVGGQIRAGATSPVGQVSTGTLFSPSALTADLGDYDVRGSID